MKMKMVRKVMFLSVLVGGWILLVPQPASAFLPCCADLNCDEEYSLCVYACSWQHPNDASCMNSCLSDANYCRTRDCSTCNAERYPCWVNPDTNCTDTVFNTCYVAYGCTYPYVCKDGICQPGGCPSAVSCSGPGYWCGSGFSRQSCDGGFCVNNPCP